jgi:hypothetical protein
MRDYGGFNIALAWPEFSRLNHGQYPAQLRHTARLVLICRNDAKCRAAL